MEFSGAGSADDVAVVDFGGFDLAGFEVEFGDVEGAFEFEAAEVCDEFAGFGGAFLAGVLDEVVVEGFASELEGGLVLVPFAGFFGEDDADAEEGFGGFGAFGLVADEFAVGIDGFFGFVAALIEFADGELGAGGGG